MTDKTDEATGFNRRNFLRAGATGAALPLVADRFGSMAHAAPEARTPRSPLVPMTLRINGQKQCYCVTLDTISDGLPHMPLSAVKPLPPPLPPYRDFTIPKLTTRLGSIPQDGGVTGWNQVFHWRVPKIVGRKEGIDHQTRTS